MWPSTSRGTRDGSPVGIWLATAVIRPNVNEEIPRKRRSRRSAVRRSLRILRRRPLEPAASVVRLRRSKRSMLALRAVPHDHKRAGRRRVSSAAWLLRHHDGGTRRNRLIKWKRDRIASSEEPRRFGRAFSRDPGFVRLPGAGRIEAPQHESGGAVRSGAGRPAREGPLAGAGRCEDLRDSLLAIELRFF